MRAWMVRAGRKGERATAALDEGLVIAGWEDVGDLSLIEDREGLRTRLMEIYPQFSSQVVANWTGQLWRFREEIAIGDLVVMPVSGSHRRSLAIGEITGPYHYRPTEKPGLRHTRPVEWKRKNVDRDTIKSDLRDSMGSLLTVFELSRNQAVKRIGSLAEHGIDPGSSELVQDRPSIASPQRLEELVQAALDIGDKVTLTVRELLNIWGHSRRWPSVVQHIHDELEERGLSTKPSFTEGNINSRIAIVSIGTEPSVDVPVPTATELSDEPPPEDRPVALLVKQLPTADTTLFSVAPNDELSVATTIMAINNFSQLPILDGEGRLCGTVSWESVGMAYLSNPRPSLEQATSKLVKEVDGDDDLLDWIPEIYRRGFIFVRDQDRRIRGIITSADLTSQLGNQLRPFLLVAEIEQRLRQIVRRVLGDGVVTIEQVRGQLNNYRRRQVHEARHLTLGEYPFVFEHEDTWQAFGWDLDRHRFLDRIRNAAQFRNDLMHLNPDLDPEDEDKLLPLQGLLGLLRSLDR